MIQPSKPLIAPKRFRGRMSKWTPESLLQERTAWAAEQGRKGYTTIAVGKALGISQRNASKIMQLGGWTIYERIKRKRQ